MKKFLVLAYYFSPFCGGGVVRPRNFVKYLPEYGCKPIVLTVQTDYYPQNLLSDNPPIPEGVPLFRTRSLEPRVQKLRQRVYGVGGGGEAPSSSGFIKALRWVSRALLFPDREVLWLPFAVTAGRRIVREEKIDVIFATSPPFSTNLAAYALARITRKPLVIDYRDDWIGNDNVHVAPQGPIARFLAKRLEKAIAHRSMLTILPTQESFDLFKSKYPAIPARKVMLLPNGFDPDYFDPNRERVFAHNGKLNFVYAGGLTRRRHPRHFFEALKRVLEQFPSIRENIAVRLVGHIHSEHVESAREQGIEDIVTFEENVAPEHLAKILYEESDVLLLFQAKEEGGKTAVPGKVYEYLAARKPILCMTGEGATANFMKRAGCEAVAGFDDVQAIENALALIVNKGLEAGSHLDDFTPKIDPVQFSRKEQTRMLAEKITLLMEEREDAKQTQPGTS